MKEKKKQRPLLINDSLYEKAVAAASKMGLSFAAYIRTLISKDTGE
jgi:hypothetical protein